ncbi:cell division ATP-binding protein FtsE [Clostridium beijerinckii]|nr:cell division ATP-binding protein FtsE [Clostridium beijerinckii]
MIKFTDVTKVYANNTLALKNVNLTIEKGDFAFLVGSSGAGKSTIIKMLFKEIEPTHGKLILNDTDVTNLNKNQIPFYRRKIGVIFQDFKLIPTLNVYENVAFALRVIGVSTKDIKKKVPMALSVVGLSDKSKSFPSQLSGGEQQRVSIARAIVNDPNILIADEPTGNLDPETAMGIMDTLDNVNKNGTTILMATHARDIVDSMRKRVIAIENGTIIRDEIRGLTIMNINTFKYYIIDALKSLNRSRTISIASVITVTATLFIMGVSILLMQNINIGMSNVESQVQIQVFLNNNITNKDQENLEQKLNNISGIKSVKFEDKSKALEKFNKQVSKDNSSLLNNYDSSNNPLPNSFIIDLENPEVSHQVISTIENMPGIESIGNDQEFTNKIISISKNMKWIGIALFILMVSVSIFLISNTIKLAIYSRRREIGIMKFVGSTDWFIRWPLIIEGALIGLFGAVCSNILIYYLYKLVFIKINENLLLINLLSPSYITQALQWQFILVGILIGSIGSSWSLIKFLKV